MDRGLTAIPIVYNSTLIMVIGGYSCSSLTHLRYRKEIVMLYLLTIHNGVADTPVGWLSSLNQDGTEATKEDMVWDEVTDLPHFRSPGFGDSYARRGRLTSLFNALFGAYVSWTCVHDVPAAIDRVIGRS